LDIKIKWNQMSSNSSQVNLIIYKKKTMMKIWKLLLTHV
jgi:hypothetical protein